jgi:NAD(P) transhydrogenase subunit beta
MNATNIGYLVQLAFIVGAALFVIGLHLMNSPATARTGNRLSAAGMIIAVSAEVIFVTQRAMSASATGRSSSAAWRVGGGLGLRMARTVAMTSMPQLVSLFNAVGGGAAALLALSDFMASTATASWPAALPASTAGGRSSSSPTSSIGSVTFTGSLIASAKLMGLIKGQPILIPGGRIVSWFTVVCGLSVSIVLILAGAGVVTYEHGRPLRAARSWPWPAPWSSAC